MFEGLKRLAGDGWLLLELQGLRKSVEQLQQSVERIADAMELANTHAFPHQAAAAPIAGVEPTTVEFVDSRVQEAYAEIELGLTAVRGIPPSEDEIVAEFERRYPERGSV
jgi:hypothetical protein